MAEELLKFPSIDNKSYPNTFARLKYHDDQAPHKWLWLFFPLMHEAAKCMANGVAPDQKMAALAILSENISLKRIDGLILPEDEWNNKFTPQPEAEKEKIISVLSLGFDSIRTTSNLDRWIDSVQQARKDQTLKILSVGGQFLVQRFKDARSR